MSRIVYKTLAFVVLLSLSMATCFAAEEESPEYKYQKFIYEGADFLKNGKSQESFARALARFKSALDIKKDSAEAQYWIALVYAEMQNYGQAAQQAEFAVILDKNKAEAWLLWGQCLLREHKYEQAKEKLKKAFQLASKNYIAAFNLGLCYYYAEPGNSDAQREALTYFQHALDLNPRYIPARLMLGICQLEKGLNILAIVNLQHVVKVAPNSIDGHFYLGLAYRKNNRFDEAESEFRAVLAQDKYHVESHLQLGHLYLRDKPSRKRAIQHLQIFVKLAPESHPWKARVANHIPKLLKASRSTASR